MPSALMQAVLESVYLQNGRGNLQKVKNALRAGDSPLERHTEFVNCNQTPWAKALYAGNLKIVDALLDFDVDELPFEDKVHILCRDMNDAPFSPQDKHRVKQLAEAVNSIFPGTCNASDDSPFQQAKIAGFLREGLLDASMPVPNEDANFNTFLGTLRAKFGGSFSDKLAIQAKRKVEINAPVTSGKFSPLEIAISENNPELVDFLLEKGANPYIVSQARRTMQELAQKKLNDKISGRNTEEIENATRVKNSIFNASQQGRGFAARLFHAGAHSVGL